jgi:hypothetical protein
MPHFMFLCIFFLILVGLFIGFGEIRAGKSFGKGSSVGGEAGFSIPSSSRALITTRSRSAGRDPAGRAR